MRILTDDFVRHYEGRLLNIHPSLLPSFPGLHTHRQALAEGAYMAGAWCISSRRSSTTAR